MLPYRGTATMNPRGLRGLLEDVLDIPDARAMSADAFEHAKTLTKADVLAKLRAANFDELVASAVADGAVRLREQSAANAEELTDKFRSDAFKGELRFASLSTFFGGLSGLIGDPKLIDGSLQQARAWGI